MSETVTSLFTFGYSQLCPYTGKDLGDHYALVTAPDRSSARLFMNTAFKRNYAFEYSGPGDPNIVDYVPRMTLHITVNLVPEQPDPYSHDSRTADAETTQPIAGHPPAHFGPVPSRVLARDEPCFAPESCDVHGPIGAVVDDAGYSAFDEASVEGHYLVYHGPVKPPYGSPEREAYDREIDRELRDEDTAMINAEREGD